MAAQVDFAKHGAVAWSEAVTFDGVVRKGSPSPLGLCTGLENAFIKSG